MSDEARAIAELNPQFTRVFNECLRQDERWGPQHRTPEIWLAILTEEVGELAEAILDYRYSHEISKDIAEFDLLKETEQVAAVAIQILRDLRGRNNW